jgi:hypothetical protein
VLIDHEEGVGGGDSELPAREAQPVVLRVETLDESHETSSSTSCCIPSGVFRPFTSMRGRNNIVSKHNVNDTTGDQPTQAGQLPRQAEAQIRTCFLTIVEISMT